MHRCYTALATLVVTGLILHDRHIPPMARRAAAVPGPRPAGGGPARVALMLSSRGAAGSGDVVNGCVGTKSGNTILLAVVMSHINNPVRSPRGIVSTTVGLAPGLGGAKWLPS